MDRSPFFRSLRRLVIMGALIATGSMPAIAQELPKSESDQTQIEPVIVTGSRIAAPNAVSTSPIQVVTAKEIQQEGKTDIVDLLYQLPQNFQNSVGDLSNTSSALTTPGGISTADLRGLGPQRTLVLINGRRLGTGDPNTANPNPSPDLDQIPAALIERVDVVTGGASAVYGSDAIGGVINFIMKKDFQGIQIDGQTGEYWHSNHQGWIQNLEATSGSDVVSGSEHDGQNRNFDLLMGSNFAGGAGNVTAYLSYLHADPIAGSDRDFGGCQLSLNTALNGVACHGSVNSNFFQTANQNIYSVVGNQLLPFPQTVSVPPASFDSQPYIDMSREDTRYNAGFFAHLDLNDHVKPYAEFGYMDDKTTEVLSPAGLFQTNPTDPTGNGNFNINCNNPLLSAQEVSIICTQAQQAYASAHPSAACVFPGGGAASPNCSNLNIGRRNIEGGGRSSYWDHTNYRLVGGANGEFATAFSYDTYASYYHTKLFNSNNNNLNYNSIDNALQVTGTAANPVCISGSPCVPWNIFNQGGVTQAALNYLYATGTSSGTVAETIEHADVTADLGKFNIKSPWANEGIGINVGAEHRSDSLTFAPDALELSGLLSGFGGASVSIDNSTSVSEGFFELRAPLLQDRPLVKDLVFDSGYRFSDYNTSGGVSTYKFEVQYAPIADVRFRGGYQRAIRAASVLELYTPQAYGGLGSPGVDPCAPTLDPVTNSLVPATASLSQCKHTGVTAAQYGNGNTVSATTPYTGTIKQCTTLECGQLLGGNPNLQPEVSESITLGLNFTPSFLPNLTTSLDFYRIKVKGEVSSVAAPIILQNCLQTGDPTYCNLITRTTSGALFGSNIATGGYIVQTELNIAAVEVKGIDVQAAYQQALAPQLGSLSFLFTGSVLLANTTTPYPGASTYDCVGLFGTICQTVNPRWRHNLRITWDTPWNLEFSALWRFIGPVTLDTNTSDPTLSNGVFDTFDARMPGMNYLDLSASWQVLKELQLRAGVNNVLDKDPPIVSANVVASGAASSYPMYDQLGRQLYVAFTAKF